VVSAPEFPAIAKVKPKEFVLRAPAEFSSENALQLAKFDTFPFFFDNPALFNLSFLE